MAKKRHTIYRILTVLAAVMVASAGMVYAAADSSTSEPARVVHKVKVDDKEYCIFAQNNVVLTPADLLKTVTETDPETGEETESIVPLTDEELTALVIDSAGLYMKEANCNEKSHSAISAGDWIDNGGAFVLGEADLAAVRGAEPADGAPVKLYMDLAIATEAVTEETTLYSTYKISSPELLFVEVATEEDAKKAEDICEPIKEETTAAAETVAQAATKVKKPKVTAVPPVEEETLPEFKTIKMTDRSGGPLEETLKDGDPVTLEWKGSSNKADSEGTRGFLKYIPGGIVGLAVAALIIAGIIAAVIAARRKDRDA